MPNLSFSGTLSCVNLTAVTPYLGLENSNVTVELTFSSQSLNLHNCIILFGLFNSINFPVIAPPKYDNFPSILFSILAGEFVK